MVEACLDAGGMPITEADVLFYELAMLAGWVLERAERHDIDRLRACLRRAEARSR